MQISSKQVRKSSGVCLRASLALNIVFLILAVLIVRVGFESNDDPTLSALVDGQMAHITAYIPYINIVLGAVLKGIYTLFGRGTAWFTLFQYLLLCAGFTALCYTLCRRLGVLYGSAVGLVLLLSFGVDAYCIINYTKTAAVCTVGGTALILHALEGEKVRRTACGIGILLALFGFMLRSMEFLPCFAITAALCLCPLLRIVTGKESVGEKLRRTVQLAVPFVLVLLLSAGLYAADEWAWSKEPWSAYHSFDKLRVACVDYGRPEYDAMPEAYDALGLSREDVELFCQTRYFDTEVFSADALAAISTARAENFPAPSIGESVGLLLDKVIPGLFINLPVYGFLFVMILWLAAGEHRARGWLPLCAGLGIFALAYLYLIYRGRYLIDRVDLGLLLAAAAVPAGLLDAEKLRRERLLTVLVLLLALGTTHFIMRDWYRTEESEDRSNIRASYERLLRDEEHVYLADPDAVTDGLWTPFEPYGQGYWDRIVLLGGFMMNHPSVMENLAGYGVENPYRDCVDNERVYLIENDIDLTLAHIRQHYNGNARAERVEALSEETGLDIYRIVTRGKTA